MSEPTAPGHSATRASRDAAPRPSSSAGEEGLTARASLGLKLSYLGVFGAAGVQLSSGTPALEEAGYAAAAIGTLWAVRSLTTAVFPPVFGALVDRRGHLRRAASLAGVAGAVALLAVPVAPSYGFALAAFAAFGMLGSATVPLTDALTLETLGKDAARYGELRLFGSLGFGVAALAMTQALREPGIAPTATTVFGAAALCMAIAVVGLQLAPAHEAPSGAATKEPPATTTAATATAATTATARSEAGATTAGETVERASLTALLVHPKLWPLWLATGLHWASHGAYTAFLPTLASTREGAAFGVDGVSLTGLSIALAIACEVGVVRASSWLLQRTSVDVVLGLAIGFGGLRWLLLALTSSSSSFVLLHGLHGLSFGLFYPAAVKGAYIRAPIADRRAAQGLLSSVTFGLGGALGMQTTGLLVGHWGATDRVWAAMAGFSAAAAVATVLAARAGHRDRLASKA